MEVQRGNVTCVAIFVASKSVDGIRIAVGKGLRRLESCIGNEGGIVGNDFGEISGAMVLDVESQVGNRGKEKSTYRSGTEDVESEVDD